MEKTVCPSTRPSCLEACQHNAIFRTFMPLETDLKYHLENLLRESCQFNANDVLVHIDPDSAKLFLSPIEGNLVYPDFPQAILREAQRTFKESGVSSLCLVRGSIRLPISGGKMVSPLWLVPLVYRFDKIRQEHSFEADEDSIFLNPYVRLQLEQLELYTEGLDASQLQEILVSKDIENDPEFSCIGNFHHHRYQVIRELEELLSGVELAPQLREIFGFHFDTASVNLELHKGRLFPSDLDHDAVFDSVSRQNTVVQGPPGTGKSQVLTNCVAKSLGAGLTNIVVSEKRAALDVIRKKLAVYGLEKLCFIATSDQLSRQFLEELKESWDFFETLETQDIKNLYLSEQYQDNLQMTLDLLDQKELIGGVSFHEFLDELGEMNLEKYHYHSDALSLRFLKNREAQLMEIYSKGLARVLGFLRTESLDREQLSSLDQQLREWIGSLEALQHLVSITTFPDLSSAMRKAALCQVYENDLVKKYAALFVPDSKAQKKFLKLRLNYLQLQEQLVQKNRETGKWKIVPTPSECETLTEQLSKGSFFGRRKAVRRWKQLSDLPVETAVVALGAQAEIHTLNETISKIKIDFCGLGLENPETEIPAVFTGIHSYTEAQWQELNNMTAEEKNALTGKHRVLQDLYSGIRTNLSPDSYTPLQSLFQELLASLPTLLTERNLLEGLDTGALRAIGRNPDYAALKGEALRSHQIQFYERFPAFSGFQPENIHAKVQAVLDAEEEEFALYARQIEQVCKAKFDRYHRLLVTPARSLSEEEKALKVQLRRGKSILVKEFGKSRQHPTLRELYHSEARLWIEVLKPVWLSNPVQLAKCFPMETDLFDLAIFDEASQMPLQHALGALQRSRRALIAGDEHQMGPSSYFRAGGNELIDLLHQANYHWQRVPLKHHYRSSHPDLIQFSNKHFYRGELQSYPSAGAQSPLHWYFIDKGRFIDRRNIEEARQVANKISELFHKSGILGVVAFSEEQLQAIRQALPVEIADQLSSVEYGGFFKTLENVQGDECDHLIISFGYGFNEENEFHLRFGPMNTANGRKRLNVLLTRARESLHFFSSVKSSDFGLSDNESVNLLKNCLHFFEHYQGEQTPQFPHDLTPVIEGTQLTLPRIQEKLSAAKEVVTLQRVLENRSWSVRYA